MIASLTPTLCSISSMFSSRAFESGLGNDGSGAGRPSYDFWLRPFPLSLENASGSSTGSSLVQPQSRPAREATLLLRVPAPQDADGLLLQIAFSKPVFEPDLSELRVVFGNKCSLLHLDAVVASVRVSDNFARILACGQTPPNKFIEAKLFRTAYFNGAIHRCAQRNLGHRTGDIVGSHGLDKHRWQAHFVSVESKSPRCL